MKRIKLIIVWLWVGIPLSWGVYLSVRKSMPLFTGVRASATRTAAKQ